jgi:hypothetical protein
VAGTFAGLQGDAVRAVKWAFVGEFLTFALIMSALIAVCAGCSGSKNAEAAYLADHLACVEKSDTLEASKACRIKVRERWDGGAK